MTTRLDLLNTIREILGDVTQWPDATINLWIDQAIRDYSHYFPHSNDGAIPCVEGVREYTLGDDYTAGLFAVTHVEYPQGQEPPRHLSRLDETSGLFMHGAFYDLRGDPPTQIVLGEVPLAGQYLKIHYLMPHKALAADEDETTVPAQHLEALSIFCIWKAAEEIFLAEEIDPATAEFLVSQMGLNATRYERIYRNKIAEYQSGSQSRRAGAWKMDDKDRVY
jgi:hypothetical protein